MNAPFRATGGAPEPDAARVQALLDGWEQVEPATFAETEIKALIETFDRVLAETRTGDLTEAAALLAHIRSAVSGLEPQALEPRGLFDSRGRRLKAFRAEFLSAARATAEAVGDLGERSGGVQRRDERLDALWAELRERITAIDVCRAAGSERCPPPPEPGEDSASDGGEPLRGRLTLAHHVRDSAIKALPCIRAAQNGDVQALARLKALPETAEAWRSDWTDALGLAGRKPKKVRPDAQRLNRTRDALLQALGAADSAIAAAKARRSDVEGRLETLRRGL